ncbi:unnamed protein product [Heligmosomoides polygyrus]|uniref:Uncharacterized protein n=1 Tax=Heligmosomoides polygyrus TaxID=6339 RepID=A0A183GTH0_HELPZ|nr:unnamed protein product [Heligmosomoides polygyrus]
MQSDAEEFELLSARRNTHRSARERDGDSSRTNAKHRTRRGKRFDVTTIADKYVKLAVSGMAMLIALLMVMLFGILALTKMCPKMAPMAAEAALA